MAAISTAYLDNIVFGAAIVAAIFGLIVAFFGAGAALASRELSRRSAIEVARANETAAVATKGAALADARAAEANAKAAEAYKVGAMADRQTAELRVQYESLRERNVLLRRVIEPRRLWASRGERYVFPPAAVQELTDVLKAFAGLDAEIQAADDAEARTFAKDIGDVLSDAGWNVRYVTSDETKIREADIPAGIRTFGNGINNWDPNPGALKLAEQLRAIIGEPSLYETLFQTRARYAPPARFDPNMVFVLVGARPVPEKLLND